MVELKLLEEECVEVGRIDIDVLLLAEYDVILEEEEEEVKLVDGV